LPVTPEERLQQIAELKGQLNRLMEEREPPPAPTFTYEEAVRFVRSNWHRVWVFLGMFVVSAGLINEYWNDWPWWAFILPGLFALWGAFAVVELMRPRIIWLDIQHRWKRSRHSLRENGLGFLWLLCSASEPP
jgi:hypothetical protein